MGLMGIAGKTAIVTGAAGGIGSATVTRLLAEGCNVVGVDLDGGAVSTACGRSANGQLLAIGADVSRERDAERYVREAIGRFGGVDFLVNNAGILGKRLPLVEMPVAEFDRILTVNLRSVFLGMQAVIRHMIERKAGGAIVNLSSMGALKTYPNSSGYGTSKNAILSLTRVAALENAEHDIRVNAICPGPTDTALFAESVANGLLSKSGGQAMGMVARPAEIANVIAFLLSDQARFVNGSVYSVDGGALLR